MKLADLPLQLNQSSVKSKFAIRAKLSSKPVSLFHIQKLQLIRYVKITGVQINLEKGDYDR